MLEVGKSLPEDWQMGITDRTLSDGRIYNNRWYAGSTEPQYFSGDTKEFSYSENDAPMFNFFQYDTFLLNNGYDFSVSTIDVTGNDTYTLPFKCADVFAVARLITVSIISVASTSSFTIPLPQSEAIGLYDSKFITNNAILTPKGIFLCRITSISDGSTYFRAFSISGNTITLQDIATGAILGITGLARSWKFELIGAYNMVLEGTVLPSSVFEGFIIKNIKIGTGEATIKFAPNDIPIKANTPEKIAVVYYALANSRPQYFDPVSILQHGIYAKTEKVDYPLQTSQLTGLQNNSLKYYQPQRKFKLKTRRPSKLKIGDSVYINVSRFPVGKYEVSSVNVTTIHPNGEKNNTTFDEQDIEFTNYDFNLDTVLLSLKNKNQVNKAKVAQLITRSYTTAINITTLYNKDLNLNLLLPPVNITFSNRTSTGFTFNFDGVAGATEYRFDLSNTADFGYYLNGYYSRNAGNNTMVVVSSPDLSIYPDIYLRIRTINNNNVSSNSGILHINAGAKTFSSFITNHPNLSILYNQQAMTGSGLSITDSKNSVVANFYKNTGFDATSAYPTWVTDTNFGNGIKISTNASALRISDNELIETPTTGTWIFIIKFFNKINQTLLNKSSLLAESLQSYQLSVSSTGQLQGELTNADSTVHGNTKYFISNSDSSFINDADLNNIIGIAFKYDVVAKTLSMIKNQTIYTWHDINPPYSGISSIYSVLNSSVDLFLGDYIFDNGDRYISGYGGRFEIYGMAMLKDNLSDAQIKTEFSNMGLV